MFKGGYNIYIYNIELRENLGGIYIVLMEILVNYSFEFYVANLTWNKDAVTSSGSTSIIPCEAIGATFCTL